MTEPGLTTEQRLARLEAKAEARSTVLMILFMVGWVLYLLFSTGHLSYAPKGGAR